MRVVANSLVVPGWWVGLSETASDLMLLCGAVPHSAGSFPDAAGEMIAVDAMGSGSDDLLLSPFLDSPLENDQGPNSKTIAGCLLQQPLRRLLIPHLQCPWQQLVPLCFQWSVPCAGFNHLFNSGLRV